MALAETSPRGTTRAPARPAVAAVKLQPPAGRFDAATALGLVMAFVLLGVAVYAGGNIAAFLNLPSVLIVLGGTLAVTMVSFSFSDLANTQRVIGRTLVTRAHPAPTVARQMLSLADHARRNGKMALEAQKVRHDPFLARAILLVCDSLPEAEIERVLQQDVEALVNRHTRSANLLRRAAEVAPAMGLIGTLVGLVQMLSGLSDPATIGPSMAVALLTTLYGAVLSTMVLSPLAGKLERRSEEEALTRQMIAVAALSIARQENPRRLELLMNTLLPPAQAVKFFD